MNRVFSLVLSTLVLSLPAPSLFAKEGLPEKTKDGLELQKHSKVGALYLKPGASLEPFDKVHIDDTFVAFKKNWQRDYNLDVVRPGDRISDKDMADMKQKIADEFKTVFTDELQKAGYEVVTNTGEGIMIIRPALINLDVAAPEPDKAFSGATIVRSAGSLTLYAELYDSATSEKFAEILDTQEADEGTFAHRATRISNKAALDSTLRHWAGLLIKQLDEAHGKKK